MPLSRTEEILNIFANCTKNAKNNLDTDISSLLEEYLVEAGLRHLNASENGEEFHPNFPQIAVLLRHSVIIYGRKVDHLYSIVQNYITSTEESTSSDGNEERACRRSKKQPENLSFTSISLEEATNITMKDNSDRKTSTVLPRAFMQFEPRVISKNDVQIKDYSGELIGLMDDFKVNWNTDKNFTLCDDMDFSSVNEPHKSKEHILHSSMVSPPDSGHNSDTFFDYHDNVLGSPDFQSDHSPSVTPFPSTPVEVPIKEAKPKKRKLPQDVQKPKKPLTKYDITSPLTGTAKSLKLEPSEFSLTSSMKRIYSEKLKDNLRMRDFIKDVYDTGDVNKKYLINEISPIFKKRPLLTWSRLEARKKLKLSLFNSDVVENPESSDDEDIGVSIFKLEKACDRLSNEITNNEDKASECSDDIFADNDIGEEFCVNQSKDSNEKRPWAESDMIPSLATGTESDNTKNIEAWHASVLDRLKKSENQKPFNLETYNGQMLDMLNSSHTINFSEILKNGAEEDVSRYFLSTLDLINKYKIVVDQPPPLSCGDFQIHLPG